MTPAQIKGVIATVFVVLVAVASGFYKLGVYVSTSPAANRGADSSISPATTVSIQPGTIVATHYPTGELFAVEPKSGTLRLISARLGQAMGLAIRPNGEIIVLDSENKAYNLPAPHGNQYLTKIIGVSPEKGYHRYVGIHLWPAQARALALDSENSALIALDGALMRVDLESGDATTIASNDLLRGASGVVRMPLGEIVVTITPDKVLKVNSADGSTVILSEGKRLWHPTAPTVENPRNVLVGTVVDRAAKVGGVFAGVAGILRVNLKTGAQELVASGGRLTSIAGMSIGSDGSILIADNGRGAPGDGFLARLDPATGQTNILVSAQSSGWKFLNGRSIAVFPRATER
jgi:hypothetical protein